jgi:hypothetical protein
MGKPNYIYIGPSVSAIGLKKNMLFRSDELPSQLLPIVANKPAIKSLYVSTRDLAETAKRLATKGSLEYSANKEMLEIARNYASR